MFEYTVFDQLTILLNQDSSGTKHQQRSLLEWYPTRLRCIRRGCCYLGPRFRWVLGPIWVGSPGMLDRSDKYLEIQICQKKNVKPRCSPLVHPSSDPWRQNFEMDPQWAQILVTSTSLNPCNNHKLSVDIEYFSWILQRSSLISLQVTWQLFQLLHHSSSFVIVDLGRSWYVGHGTHGTWTEPPLETHSHNMSQRKDLGVPKVRRRGLHGDRVRSCPPHNGWFDSWFDVTGCHRKHQETIAGPRQWAPAGWRSESSSGIGWSCRAWLQPGFPPWFPVEKSL